MSQDMQTIERELEEFLATSDYEVRFRHAHSYSFFYVYVFHRGERIAEKTFHPPFNSYAKAARWAKKRARQHAEALEILGPLHRRVS